jgi:hypothetical protein
MLNYKSVELKGGHHAGCRTPAEGALSAVTASPTRRLSGRCATSFRATSHKNLTVAATKRAGNSPRGIPIRAGSCQMGKSMGATSRSRPDWIAKEDTEHPFEVSLGTLQSH